MILSSIKFAVYFPTGRLCPFLQDQRQARVQQRGAGQPQAGEQTRLRDPKSAPHRSLRDGESWTRHPYNDLTKY